MKENKFELVLEEQEILVLSGEKLINRKMNRV